MAEAEVEVKDAVAETDVETPKEPDPETVEAPEEPPPEEPTMRVIVLTGHGGYGKLKVENHPKPNSTEGHVVVKVHACGLNFADLMQRQGMYPHSPKLPYVPGFECSGVIEEVGEQVTGFEVGSRVCCIVLSGAWAEYVLVPFTSCFAMPESMSFEEGAAFPVVYLTAYLMLFYCGNLGKRKSVLIHMAAGGVGTAATQICKTVEGVTVFGTASASKHEAISKNGVDHPIDYRTEDYVEAIKKVTSSIDLVLDPLGGPDTKKCYDLLSPLGTLVIFGWASNVAESKSMFSGFKSVARAQQKMHDRINIGKILLSPLKEPEPEPEPIKKRKKSGSKLHAEQTLCPIP
ncbi:hypothetical protein QZH41_009860 [Actinostola sp. cb2023]|nr:hypothetical protein QZH41_009860 [Actinostola sp. cb2023]